MFAFIEVEPATRLPASAFASCFDAHSNKACTCFDCEVVTFPVVGHLRCILTCEAELAEGEMLAGVAKKFR